MFYGRWWMFDGGCLMVEGVKRKAKRGVGE
jgi:hypothetical protein